MASQKTDNELIAEFCGFEVTEGPPHNLYHITFGPDRHRHIPAENFCFDSSWEWAMGLISEMFMLWVPADDTNPFQKSVNIRLHNFQRNTPISSHIQQVYKNALKFIKWYNEQKPS